MSTYSPNDFSSDTKLQKYRDVFEKYTCNKLSMVFTPMKPNQYNYYTDSTPITVPIKVVHFHAGFDVDTSTSLTVASAREKGRFYSPESNYCSSKVYPKSILKMSGN